MHVWLKKKYGRCKRLICNIDKIKSQLYMQTVATDVRPWIGVEDVWQSCKGFSKN